MAKRKYTQKQIDALAGIADAEFIQALYPYTKDRPLARLGLDAHLFETGQIDPDNFKQKLLNIRQYPDQRMGIKVGPNEYQEVGGIYNVSKDVIDLYASAFEYKDKTTGKRKKGKGYKGPGQIETLLHELEHRGYTFLEKVAPLNDYLSFIKKGSAAEEQSEHIAMRDREMQTAKDLGIEVSSAPVSASDKMKDIVKKRQKKREREALQKSVVKKRFPSIKQYNRGGKVYSNQPRRVRISRGR